MLCATFWTVPKNGRTRTGAETAGYASHVRYLAVLFRTQQFMSVARRRQISARSHEPRLADCEKR